MTSHTLEDIHHLFKVFLQTDFKDKDKGYTQNTFRFSEARMLFNSFTGYPDIDAVSLLTNFQQKIEEGIKPKGFFQSIDKSDETYPFWEILYKLIAHIDRNAYREDGWLEKKQERIARANVRQDDWIVNLLKYKIAGINNVSKHAHSIRNVIEYLSNPIKGTPMLSLRHQNLVWKHILHLDPNLKGKRNSHTFAQNLSTFFKPIFPIELQSQVLEENKTWLYVWFLYRNEKLWKVLDVYLEKIRIQNFQGIKDLTLGEFRNNNWIILTGENGFGKTCILQSIVLGLEGFQDRYELREDNPMLKIELDGKKRNLLEIPKNKLPVIAYGSSRLETTAPDFSIDKMSSATKSLFEPVKLLSIETLLIDWWQRGKSNEKWKNLYKLVKNVFTGVDSDTTGGLLPNLYDIKIQEDVSLLKSKVLYIEQDKYGVPYENLVPFSKLASGYKNVLAMVGDMLVRLLLVQKDKELENLESLEGLEGIVIIDEIDLHLHPKLQRNFPSVLSQIFPNIQFIISTHSAIPILGAPENSKFLKVTRTIENGIQIQEIELEYIRNLTPNTLLTSPIFDFEDIFPKTHKDEEPIRTEDTYKEILERENIQKQLAELLEKYPVSSSKIDENEENL